MTPLLDVEAAQKDLGFGWYQIRNFVLMLLPIVATSCHNSNYVFVAADVEYRCLVPECESEPPEFLPGQWREWALPEGDALRCYRYTPRDSNKTCTQHYFSNVTDRCNAWIYRSNNSIVAEFDLACEDWKRTLVGTVHYVGKLIVVTFIGLLSDRFGRLPVYVFTAVGPVVTGVARAFSASYPVYVAFEFLDALCGAGAYTTGFVLIMELTSVDNRVIVSNLVPVAYSVGQMLLAGLAWAVTGWRTLLLTLYLPSSLFITYYFLLDESPRWLATRGRYKEAATILLRAAKVNGITLTPEFEREMLTEEPPRTEAVISTEISETLKLNEEDSNNNPNVECKNEVSIASQVIHSKLLMCRLAMCAFWWITCALVFHGLSINSVSLAGNKYFNFTLTTAAEIPGYLLSAFALDRFGRRVSIRTSFLLCGVALVSMPLIPKDLSSVLLTLSLVGKVWISMAFCGLYTYTSELFPTQARHTMVATCYVIGRIGQVLAPQAPILVLVWAPLPYLMFGVLAVLAALVTWLAPETRHKPLPDTVSEAEQAHYNGREIKTDK